MNFTLSSFSEMNQQISCSHTQLHNLFSLLLTCSAQIFIIICMLAIFKDYCLRFLDHNYQFVVFLLKYLLPHCLALQQQNLLSIVKCTISAPYCKNDGMATQSEITEYDGITHVISIANGGPSRPRPSQSYIFYHSLSQADMIYSNSAVIRRQSTKFVNQQPL